MSTSLRELVVSLSLRSDNFSRNIRSVNAQIKEAQSAFLLAGAGVQNFENTLAGTASKLDMLRSTLKSQGQATMQYQGQLASLESKLTSQSTQLTRLKTTLSTLEGQYSQSRAKVQELRGAYASLASDQKASESATLSAKAKLELAEKAFEALGAEIKKTKGQITAVSKGMQGTADAIAMASTKLNQAKATYKSMAVEIKVLERQLAVLQSAWTRASVPLLAFGATWMKVGRSVATAGQSLMLHVTTPLLALGAAAIKSSLSFESAFTSVRKTVKATEDEFAYLSNRVKAMSTELATSTTDIAETMAVAGQLGIETAHLDEFTKIMIDLGNSTDIVANEAATTLAKFANITSMNQGEFDRLGSTLVALGNNYATTESSIMLMAKRLAAAGTQIGLSEAQILGFSTALSAVGIEAEMGGSAFSKALIKMEVAAAKGGQALEDFATVSGMTEQQFVSQWESDPAQVFQSFITGLANMDDEGMSAIAVLDEIGIAEIRLRDTMLRAINATELFSDTQTTATQAWEENTALTAEAERRYATTESQLKNLMGSMHLFGQQIGDDLNPSIRDMISNVDDMVQDFLVMDKASRMSIIQTGAGIAAIGPALLVAGKSVQFIGGTAEVLGKVSAGVGKFSGAVKVAGGGMKGLGAVMASSTGLWVALGIAAIGAGVAIYDVASGAKATREALAEMNDTAKDWKNTAQNTFYSTSKGLSAFGLDSSLFETAETMETWMDTVLTTWAEGGNKTKGTNAELVTSFQALADGASSELAKMKDSAENMGLSSVSESMDKDMKSLSKIEKEIERLVNKRKHTAYSTEEVERLQQLIDERGKILVKYGLVPADESGFDEIERQVNAEVARTQARGEAGASIETYENAIVASSEGYGILIDQINQRYDEEFALISLMEDGVEKQTAMDTLNQSYLTDRKQATQEYAETLAEMVMPVWEQDGIQETGEELDNLQKKLQEYSLATTRGENTSGIVQDINAITKSMDEGQVAEYFGMLSQVSSLLNEGMSIGEVQALFPEMDVAGNMSQFATLMNLVNAYSGTFEGLQGMFGEALPEELLKIGAELDMDAILSMWNGFAENPTAITAEAQITKYTAEEGITVVNPVVKAIVKQYKLSSGVTVEDISPQGLIAMVETFAIKTGIDTSNLTPEVAEAFIMAYKELENGGTDMSALTPDEIVAKVKKYAKANDIDVKGLEPVLEAMVVAYEELNGASATLTPPEIAAVIIGYAEESGLDPGKLTEPQIDALITGFEEATDLNLTDIKPQVVAQIVDIVNLATKQLPISAFAQIVGYDLTALNNFTENKPQVEVEAVVRLGELHESPVDILKEWNVDYFDENGVEIPVSAVSAGMLTATDLVAVEEDGTLHVIVTPKIQGTTESVGEAGKSLPHTDIDFLTRQVQSYTYRKGTWMNLWGLTDGMGKWGTENWLKDMTSAEDMASMTTFVQEALTASMKGVELSEEDQANLVDIFNFASALQEAGIGEDILAGIAAGMTQAGWQTDTDTVASNLESAMKASFIIQSPSQLMVPVGEQVSAGVGMGMMQYPLGMHAFFVAFSLFSSLMMATAFMPFALVGTTAMAGVASGIAGYPIATSSRTIATKAVSALRGSLNAGKTVSIGRNAAQGVALGIMAGIPAAVAAARMLALATVAAMRSALSIHSPSRVFRDEVGKQIVAGVVMGIEEENKRAMPIIQNASVQMAKSAKSAVHGGQTITNNKNDYDQSSTVQVTGNTFYVQSEQDVRSLAIEISALTKRQQRGKGVR